MTRSTEKTIFLLLLGCILLASLVFLTLGIVLNKEFISKYSPDNDLSTSTLDKMNMIRLIFFVANVTLLILALVVLYAHVSVTTFITSHKNTILGVIVFIVVVVFLIVSAELILRALYYEHTTRDGASPGNVRFNRNYFVLNNEYMRDTNFTLVKENDTVRIVALGDSFTAGWGVKNVSDLYLNRLEKSLNVEIYNFGVGGYGTDDEINVLKERGLKYNPDAIIIGYMLNDFKNVDSNVSEPSSKRFVLPVVGFWLRSSSYLYYFIESRVNNILFVLTADKTHEQYMREALASEANQNHNAAYFTELKTISEQQDLPVLIVIFPIFQDMSNYSFADVHTFIQTSAENNGLYVLDLLPFYTNYTDDELIVSRDDRHPNEFAHAIAAEEIKRFIESNASFDLRE